MHTSVIFPPSVLLAAEILAGVHGGTAFAQVIIESESYTPNAAIFDDSLVGLAQTVSFPATIASITDVSVDLQITGGFTGDYYVYLQHDTGLAVLLNRAGRTAQTGAASLGYLDGGFDITLTDDAANGDIHAYQSVVDPEGGILTGEWQPDGRNQFPWAVDGSEPRNANLTTFNGLASGGDWTLFVADVSAGGSGVLNAWSLEVTGVAVPEPGELVAIAAAGLLVLAGVRFRQHRIRYATACEDLHLPRNTSAAHPASRRDELSDRS